jgi:hypothetical protein
MKIVAIFADKLFAFQYLNEIENELFRLLELWNDPEYLRTFIIHHEKDIGNKKIDFLIDQLLDDAIQIDDLLERLSTDDTKRLEEFFKPLDNQEYQITILSKQKGRRNHLRIYALKIDDNCFVITGGAIKFTHFMEDRVHTDEERMKLNRCKQFLNENGVFDCDSFYGFLCEQL